MNAYQGVAADFDHSSRSLSLDIGNLEANSNLIAFQPKYEGFVPDHCSGFELKALIFNDSLNI